MKNLWSIVLVCVLALAGFSAGARLPSATGGCPEAARGHTTNAFVTTPLTGQTNEVFDRFEFEDRLFERRSTLNSQLSTINLLHDGDGNRVAKTVVSGTNTLTTLYVVDDRNPTGYAQVLEELTAANGAPFAVTRLYTWGHALLSQDQVLDDGLGGLAWTASFAGHDGLGSVRYLTSVACGKGVRKRGQSS